MSQPKYRQPTIPYRKAPLRRMLDRACQRLHGRGPRALEAIAVLAGRWPEIKSGVIYMGDRKLAERMSRCQKTAHRAKHDLELAGVVKLHHTRGGKTLNSAGQPVPAATGYEVDPSLTRPPLIPRAAATRVDSPAQARVRAEGQGKIQAALDRMRARAGP